MKYRRLTPKSSGMALQRDRPCPMCRNGQPSVTIPASDSASRHDNVLLCIEDFQCYEDLEGKNRVVHRIVACGQCGFVYTNPCYTPEGFTWLFEKAGKSYGQSAGRCHEQAAWLLQHIPGSESVLDIGCGAGAFLKALPQGITRYGIDIDAASINDACYNDADEHNAAIHFINADLTNTFFEPDTAQGGIPDVATITLFHVLEHIPDPQKTLLNLRAQCRDNAALIVEVPVIDRATTEQDQDIVGFYTIQHLSHFSKASLHAMLRRCGWRVKFSDDISGYNGYRVLAIADSQQHQAVSSSERQGDEAATNDYLMQWRRNVAQVETVLSTLLASIVTPVDIIIWGAGQHTEYLCHLTGIFNSECRFLIVDSDPLKQGTTLHGIAVLAPDAVPEKLWRDGTEPIIISSYGGQPQIEQQLLQRGVAQQRIISLYKQPNAY